LLFFLIAAYIKNKTRERVVVFICARFNLFIKMMMGVIDTCMFITRYLKKIGDPLLKKKGVTGVFIPLSKIFNLNERESNSQEKLEDTKGVNVEGQTMVKIKTTTEQTMIYKLLQRKLNKNGVNPCDLDGYSVPAPLVTRR
jgi:hypothetical protein